jgi:hypothetical protein
MYRMVLAIAAVTALFINLPQSRAQEGTWCSSVQTGDSSETIRCDFASYDECRQEISGGNHGSCYPNPRAGIQPANPAPRPR